MKRELQRIDIPGEHDARERSWRVLQTAFAERERVTWPRRHGRSLILAAAGAAIVAAAVTPPGRSVVNSIRDAVGREKVVGVRPAHRELVRLPAAGKLLVNSPGGAWVVAGTSRRRLGGYRMASWSPHGLFVAAVRGYELFALDPKGNVRWSTGRKQPIAYPRWSYEGYRLAYLSGDSLRISIGDGSADWGLGSADAHVPPAWRPTTHDVAFVGVDGAVRVADADAKKLLWRGGTFPDGVRALTWSDDGTRLLVLGRTSARVYDAAGRLLGSAPTKGPALAGAFAPRSHRFALVVGASLLLGDGDTLRFGNRPLFTGTTRLNGLAWSPDGNWLLVGWPAADQLVFVHVAKPPKLDAVSNIARQFDPNARTPAFPTLAGWCCTS